MGSKRSRPPSKNPKKCPFICFAPDKNIISRTFNIRGALVFLCPKEGEERRETRDERQEMRDERKREREKERKREREKERKRETRDERRKSE